MNIEKLHLQIQNSTLQIPKNTEWQKGQNSTNVIIISNFDFQKWPKMEGTLSTPQLKFKKLKIKNEKNHHLTINLKYKIIIRNSKL